MTLFGSAGIGTPATADKTTWTLPTIDDTPASVFHRAARSSKLRAALGLAPPIRRRAVWGCVNHSGAVWPARIRGITTINRCRLVLRSVCGTFVHAAVAWCGIVRCAVVPTPHQNECGGEKCSEPRGMEETLGRDHEMFVFAWQKIQQDITDVGEESP